MNIHHISIQGAGEWNEDAVILRSDGGFYGVIDGATSLVPFRSVHGETGGRLASQIIKDYFKQIPGDDRRDLETLAKEANKRLGEAMRAEGIRMDRKSELWTAAMAVVRVKEHHIEYVQAGDCMIMALYQDGSIRTITRDHVAHIGEESMAVWKKGIDSGIRSKEALRGMVLPHLLENREKMNTRGGYSVLNGLPDADRYLEYGKINRIRLSGLLLVTDGLFYPEAWPQPEAENDNLRPDEELLRRVASEGLERYAKRLLALEEDDPECIRYPRLKMSDDKTGIWITF